MSKVLVTGTSGFIARHLIRELDKREQTVIEIDTVRGIDCRDYFRTDQDGADIAIHCAAITGGIEGTTGRPAYLSAVNSQSDGAFFEWALRTKPKRIVYFSSSCAYPMADPEWNGKLKESHLDLNNITTHPDNTYGWVKLIGEVMANSVREAGIPTTIVRPFAVYGSDQENCRMIPKFIERALAPKDTFEVWGNGDQCSDFIHIDDTVAAIMTLIDNDIDGPVNLGTGRGVSVDHAASMVMSAAGISRPIVHNLWKPSGPRWRVADPTLLKSYYEPRITLEEGIARALKEQG